MKKIILLTLSAVSILSLVFVCCSCSSKNEEPVASENEAQVVNPISEITAEEAASELGLKKIALDGIVSLTKIDVAETYDIEASVNSINYTIRIKKYEKDENTDISGIYLNGNIESAVFDSADIEKSPSVNVQSDGEYTVSYGEWNGYTFSLSTSDKTTLEDMSQASVNVLTNLIAKDNIK